MNSVNFLNIEYIFVRISDFFSNFDFISLANKFIHFIEWFTPICIVIILFQIFILIFSYVRVHQIEHEEDKKFQPQPKSTEPEVVPEQDTALNEKWQQVQELMKSATPGDWRLAILEADIMLDNVLDKMGYQGDTLGDKLKSVSKSDFLTLNQAWDAHKVRNQIAHQGSDFQLNQREAQATIDLYKQVFEEFFHI